MPTFNVRIGNSEYEVDAPDENTAWKWANATHAPKPEVPEESKLFKAGRTMPTWAQGALKLGDVLSSGLAKRMAGPQTSEMVRGATTQLWEKNPAMSFGAELAGTVPQMLIAPETAVGRAVTIPQQVARTGMTSAVQGGLSGLGASNAQTPEEALQDVLGGAAGGTAMGVGTLGAGKAVAGMVGPVARRTGAALGATQFGSVTPAQRRLALALSRDIPEEFAGTPGEFALSQMRQLGPEGRIADVGKSTRKLADLMANLPGRGPEQFETAIRARQAGRAGRLMEGAQESLNNRADFTQTLDSLARQKMEASEPFYAALRDVTVPVDDELVSMLRAGGREAVAKSNRLARLAGKDPIALKEIEDSRDIITNAIIPGKQLSFDSLDKVKQALYDLESKFARSGEKAESAGFGNLRRRLTNKLDTLSPKDDAGVSIYSKARNAFAGPAQLEDAVTLGRDAFTRDPVEMGNLVKDMTQSEREAFQIGALQALRDKTGTEAGQTSLLKYWKEPKTSDALRRVFGDKYDNFVDALEREARLKEFEGIGRGSQTFGREAASEDQGTQLLLEGAEAASRAATQPWSLIGTVQRGSSRLQMPENVRNQLAKLLLQQGGNAEQELRLLDKVMQDAARKRARSAALSGALGGAVGSKVTSD